METVKYYLTKEEQQHREKWDRYSIEKTAEMKGDGQRQRKTALKMLKKGMDIELISELTELSIEDINKLKGPNGNC